MGVVKDSSSDVQIAGIQKFETKDTTLHRRFSARLQKIPDDKMPFYGNDRKRMVDINNETLCNKKAKVKHPKQACLPSACGKNVTEEDIVDESDDAMDVILKAGREKTVGAKGCESNWLVTGTSLFDAKGKSFSARVKKTLRTFNLHYLHFVQEEEKRCSTEIGRAHENARKRTSKRPDLKAIKQMGENKEFLYTARRFGHIPGIKIGHKFFSRCEMVVVGFHMHWLSGIDYIGKTSGKRLKYKGYTFPLAVGIVLSGRYEDDVDYPEEIVYTGQGGNDLLGNKSQIKDQVMNRVVRGHKCGTSYSKKVYTYDGLYEVVNHWKDKGAAGFIVYKHRLKRLPGQPNLESDQVHFVRGQVSKVQSELPQFVCQDISNGQEKLCIPATNAIDDPPVSPAGFTYVNHIQVERSINIPPNAPGCNCEGTCSNAKTCSCARLNGFDFPYVLKNGGRLIEAMDVVFECGPNCGCGPDCINRISQRELKYKLEVYRSCNKGWAVRSWDFIPSGAPVCEYTGVLGKTDELDGISENDYIFEIDCWQTMNGLGGRERRLRDVHLPSDHSDERDNKKLKCVPEFAIDGGSSGNVSRFINHSCEPNLFVQCVLSSHHDVRFARIVLFAADNIAPMQELTYDYGYMLDSVKGPDGKIKTLPCYCGAAGCRKRLY